MSPDIYRSGKRLCPTDITLRLQTSDLRLHHQTATCGDKLKHTVVPIKSAQGGSNVPKRSDFYVLHDEVEVCTKVP